MSEPTPEPPERIVMQWQHPVSGTRTEVLCREHEREVLGALRVLGIGSGGTSTSSLLDCDRCPRGGSDV